MARRRINSLLYSRQEGPISACSHIQSFRQRSASTQHLANLLVDVESEDESCRHVASLAAGYVGGTSCAAEWGSEVHFSQGSRTIKHSPLRPLKTNVDSAGHLLYQRHFWLLTCFSVWLCVMAQLHVSGPIVASFAIYGALHAAALIMSLRARQSVRRVSLFIVLSAALSVVVVRIGIAGMQVSGPLPAYLTAYVVLGFSSMTGAMGYAVLVRLFAMRGLGSRGVVVISIVCMSATHLAIFTLRHSHFLGPWWLAVLWWYAFSFSLWYFDRAQVARGERTWSGRTPRPVS